MIKKTLGGDRLGSGNKMKAAMHNYERSTHDLGNVWRSTMAPGVLVPFYKKICTNGDTWTINLRELVRTMPAIGPLFGSYKLQLDMFEIPIRLYNGILHNNMTKIGMDMAKVKLPKITLTHRYLNRENYTIPESEKKQISSSSLICYTGQRGLGACIMSEDYDHIDMQRKIQCIPILGYYDIFKNYYANKQEENAFVIDTKINTKPAELTEVELYSLEDTFKPKLTPQTNTETGGARESGKNYQVYNNELNLSVMDQYYAIDKVNKLTAYFNGPINKSRTKIVLYNYTKRATYPTYEISIQDLEYRTYTDGTLTIKSLIEQLGNMEIPNWESTDKIYHMGLKYLTAGINTEEIFLKEFPLTNIDEMRYYLLRNTTLGTEITINEFGGYPYKANWDVKSDGNSGCRNTMAGLCVKTYQSDIFNNWLSSQWIDSIKGINAISAVAVEEGKFTIDALNLAHKVYNMLNRIAISGGTYEDWQEAVYGEDALRRAESPIYCGGASGIIAFEEVVSTADTLTETAGDQPLGSLAGKGTLTNVQGGEIEIHIKEPSYIMGIVSITPYIDYCQGNDFDLTEIDTLNDLHKPELDEIGFQDLILERAAWFNTVYDTTQETPQWVKLAGGKLPAWIEYMTSVNQVYGEFAEKDKLGYMVLTRDYEEGFVIQNESIPLLSPTDAPIEEKISGTKDWTTYINPTKFNYQFADTSLTAQNFWVQIGINATCRRKISAKLIPNL